MGPAIGVIAAVAGAAASVVGTIKSTKASKKAAAAQAQQNRLQERRSRRQAIRESQITRAQALASAQGAGALQSSGVSGGVGSISSQLGETLGFQSQFGGLSDIITSQQQKAADGQQLAGFGSQLFNFGLNQGAFQQQQPNSPAASQGNFVSAFSKGNTRPQARSF